MARDGTPDRYPCVLEECHMDRSLAYDVFLDALITSVGFPKLARRAA
jgi:hypothetical protein